MPSRPTAPGAPHLSRARIEQAAVLRADRDGLATLSLRHLADDLDVTPMALYRHVAGKDDLLEAVADARLAALGVPGPRKRWRPFLLELALSLRQLFRSEPDLLSLFTRRAVTSPAAQARLTAAIAVLDRAGFAHDAAIEAYAAVHTYTVGFCALEAGRRRDNRTGVGRQPALGAARPPAGTAAGPAAGPAADAGADAGADTLATTIRGFVSDHQFDVGLHALLAGLAPEPR